MRRLGDLMCTVSILRPFALYEHVCNMAVSLHRTLFYALSCDVEPIERHHGTAFLVGRSVSMHVKLAMVSGDRQTLIHAGRITGGRTDGMPE